MRNRLQGCEQSLKPRGKSRHADRLGRGSFSTRHQGTPVFRKENRESFRHKTHQGRIGEIHHPLRFYGECNNYLRQTFPKRQVVVAEMLARFMQCRLGLRARINKPHRPHRVPAPARMQPAVTGNDLFRRRPARTRCTIGFTGDRCGGFAVLNEACCKFGRSRMFPHVHVRPFALGPYFRTRPARSRPMAAGDMTCTAAPSLIAASGMPLTAQDSASWA